VRRLLILIAVAAAASGCSHAGGVTTIMPDYALPSDDTRDWVSYGDQLSVVRVLDETPPRLPPDWKNSGGLIGRTITVRIERTLWHRPNAPSTGGELRMRELGWMMENDQEADSPKHPLAAYNAPRFEVGERYLVVLVRLRGTWTQLTDEAVMTLDGDTVTSEVVDGTPSKPAAALKGRTVTEAGTIVAATKPYAKVDRP
jgi:hypothetical protein